MKRKTELPDWVKRESKTESLTVRIQPSLKALLVAQSEEAELKLSDYAYRLLRNEALQNSKQLVSA